MIRIIVFSLFLLLSFGLSAQADRQVSEVGKLGYQYSRTFERNPQNANELIVTFVFVNGCRQHAITLRQEFEKDCFRWISTPDGTRGGESFVAFSTANLAPNQSVIWNFGVDVRPRSVRSTFAGGLLRPLFFSFSVSGHFCHWSIQAGCVKTTKTPADCQPARGCNMPPWR